MRRKACLIAGLTSVVLFAYAGTASALTLGITSPPTGSTEEACTNAPARTVVQQTQDPSTPYFVPVGGGTITQWQTNTTGDTAGAPITFAVLRPAGGTNYTVVGAETTTIPSPLPTGGVATYTLPTPIVVQAGDTLGLYSTSTGVGCYFTGGSTPPGGGLAGLTDSSPPPSTGQTLTQTGPGSGSGFTMNVAAALSQSQDAAVSTTAGPAGAAAGRPGVLSSTVTNNGPAAGPITFVDQVPSGLAIDAAAAGDGTCSIAGQTVTCTISGLLPGQSVPLDVVVTPGAAGSYINHVSVGVSPGVPDPNSANNTASATLAVGPAVSSQVCVVPKLKGMPSGVAKTVLKHLACKVKISRSHSKSVRKGLVIKTKPGKGTYAYQRKITLVVSSGPKKKHHR